MDRQPSAYSNLMMRSDLSFQDKFNASQYFPGSTINKLAGLGFSTSVENINSLVSQNTQLQYANGLFDPATHSTLVVQSYLSAGETIGDFSQFAKNATSFNPVTLEGKNYVGVGENSLDDTMIKNGFELVANIFVVRGNDFTNLAEGYGAALYTKDNSGYNGDSLQSDYDSYKNTLPENEAPNGLLAISGGVIDASDFGLKVREYSAQFGQLGQVSVYTKNNELFYTVKMNQYHSTTNSFTKFYVSQKDSSFRDVQIGLQHGK